MFGGDDGNAARVVCRDADQGAAAVRDHGVRVHVAAGEYKRQHPTMLGPTHGAGGWWAVGSKCAPPDVEGPTSAESWVDLLGISSMGCG